MDVNNIFNFVRPSSSKTKHEEDSLSIAFGFLLQNDPKLLRLFLEKLKLPTHKIKDVRIKTQESIRHEHERGRSDLEIYSPNEFLLILESKIGEHKDKNTKQLEKYANYLRNERKFYSEGVKLIYVTKRKLEPRQETLILNQIGLNEKEFAALSWEDLLLIVPNNRKALNELFRNWMGDKMNQTKLIGKQYVEDTSEVLMVYTKPIFKKLLDENNIVVQHKNAKDALYIAIIETGRKGKDSAITCLCKVKETKIEPAYLSWKNCSAIDEYKKSNKHGDPKLTWEHKVYVLEGKPIPLSEEKPMKGSKGQRSWTTTFGELISKKTGKEMKTVKQSHETA